MTLTRTRLRLALAVAVLSVGIGAVVITRSAATATTTQGGQGWAASDTIAPDALLKELRGPAPTPTVLFTGPVFLYRTGHIPGSVLIGPTSTSDGLARLRAWAQAQPRSTRIVVYCGCCPIQVCPNLTPSFAALRGMGFTHVRLLMLPTSFGADWVGRGFPIER